MTNLKVNILTIGQRYNIKFKDNTVNTDFEQTIEEVEIYKAININENIYQDGDGDGENDYIIGKTITIEDNSYIFLGWKDESEKTWDEGFYTRMNVPNNNDMSVTLTANWGESSCTVRVKVEIEEIDSEKYKLSNETFDLKITNETTVSNYLSSDIGKTEIENIINSLEEAELNENGIKIYNGDIEITQDDIEITQDDIENETTKEITLKIPRKKYLLTIDLGDGIKSVTVNGIESVEGQYKKYENITISVEKEERQEYTFNNIEWTTSEGESIQNDGNEYGMQMPGKNVNLSVKAIYTPKVAKAIQGEVSTYHESVQSAVDEIANGKKSGTVMLLIDEWNENTTVTIQEDTEILYDTNGKTLTSESGDTITNNGTLTIIGNGTIKNTSSANYAINNNGTLNAKEGTITSSYRGINNTGTIYVNGATVSAEGYGIDSTDGKIEVNSGKVQGAYAIYNSSDSENAVTINGGDIISESESGSAIGIRSTIGTITVTGGTIKASSENANCTGINITAGTVNITGGSIFGYSTNTYGRGIAITEGKINISR